MQPWPNQLLIRPVGSLLLSGPLYLLMGYAFYLIWTQKTKLNKTHAYALFFIQLFLNLIWSYLFFALRLPPLALVEIIILWLAILLTIFKFKAINKLAAYLLILYPLG